MRSRVRKEWPGLHGDSEMPLSSRLFPIPGIPKFTVAYGPVYVIDICWTGWYWGIMQSLEPMLGGNVQTQSTDTDVQTRLHNGCCLSWWDWKMNKLYLSQIFVSTMQKFFVLKTNYWKYPKYFRRQVTLFPYCWIHILKLFLHLNLFLHLKSEVQTRLGVW